MTDEQAKEAMEAMGQQSVVTSSGLLFDNGELVPRVGSPKNRSSIRSELFNHKHKWREDKILRNTTKKMIQKTKQGYVLTENGLVLTKPMTLEAAKRAQQVSDQLKGVMTKSST